MDEKTIRTAIVDDEPYARADLRHLLSFFPCIDISWEAGTFKTAETMLQTIPADLVFLDVLLRGGSGFDLIPFINPDETILIFITAHEKYKPRALNTIAHDCILKPASPRRLEDLLTRFFGRGEAP